VMVELQPGGAAAAVTCRVDPAAAQAIPLQHRTPSRARDIRGGCCG
jgi:hypothetical protein